MAPRPPLLLPPPMDEPLQASSLTGKKSTASSSSSLRSPVTPIQVSKVAVFYEYPTPLVITKVLRHLIAAVLTLNKKYSYHVQLSHIHSDGAHLDDVENSAYSADSITVFVGDFHPSSPPRLAPFLNVTASCTFSMMFPSMWFVPTWRNS